MEGSYYVWGDRSLCNSWSLHAECKQEAKSKDGESGIFRPKVEDIEEVRYWEKGWEYGRHLPKDFVENSYTAWLDPVEEWARTSSSYGLFGIKLRTKYMLSGLDGETVWREVTLIHSLCPLIRTRMVKYKMEHKTGFHEAKLRITSLEAILTKNSLWVGGAGAEPWVRPTIGALGSLLPTLLWAVM